MKQLHKLYNLVLNEGIDTTDRTGIGTRSVFGETIKFDMKEGFPAVTTKSLAWKAVVSELLWFLKGSTNVNELRAILHGEENRFNFDMTTIWDDNYNAQGKALGYIGGDLGPVYGGQWRGECSHGIDQLTKLIERAKSNPECRRLILMAWNPDDIDKMALPPCHYGFQLKIYGDTLHLLWSQRSVDSFLGLPFNIASYALLLHILCRILDKKPGTLTGQLGDVHIYKNHFPQVIEQLSRESYDLPDIWINPDLKTLEDFTGAKVSDFKLIRYKHHPAIKAKMAI